MAEIHAIEKPKLEKLFEMKSGYVLDFSDRSMADFFIDAVQVDIEGRARYGDASKANRMRKFWRIEAEYRVGKLVEALIEYRAFKRGDRPDDDHELVEDCRAIARRLMAGSPMELTDARVLHGSARPSPHLDPILYPVRPPQMGSDRFGVVDPCTMAIFEESTLTHRSARTPSCSSRKSAVLRH